MCGLYGVLSKKQSLRVALLFCFELVPRYLGSSAQLIIDNLQWSLDQLLWLNELSLYNIASGSRSCRNPVQRIRCYFTRCIVLATKGIM